MGSQSHQFRLKAAGALLLAVITQYSPDTAAQSIFRESRSNASHRVLDEIAVPGAGLPTMIQSALLKRLQQHFDSGNSIDHERLAEMLDRMPLLDPQTRDTVKNMAQFISPETAKGKPGVPDNLHEIISQQIKNYETDRNLTNDRARMPFESSFDASTLQKMLQSNRSIADSIRANQHVDDARLNELTRRFQEGSNRANQFTESRRNRFGRRQVTSATSKRSADANARSAADGGLAKKVLESAFEALDESSMEFLKSTKDQKQKPWDFAWLGKATKSLRSGAREVNRSLAGVTTIPASTLSLPDAEIADEAGGTVGATILVIVSLGLVGFLLRRWFYQNASPLNVTRPKRFRFSPAMVVDRRTFVNSVNRLATEMCGRDLSYDHHGSIFAVMEEFGKGARELAPIYAKCRYAPGEYSLSSRELESVQCALRSIHQSRFTDDEGAG